MRPEVLTLSTAALLKGYTGARCRPYGRITWGYVCYVRPWRLHGNIKFVTFHQPRWILNYQEKLGSKLSMGEGSHRGELRADDRVCAEAEGLFIKPRA
ncbi:MAG: hypothetical protein CM15mP49_34500 [Actinomycetota bacterium]|nr:MAG: hypothetical protein CM15mP49_34500 [Actinomycetota bacterium]